MCQFRRIYSLQNHAKLTLRYAGLPVTADASRIHQPAKKKDDGDANRGRRPDFFAEPGGLELQRVFNRADLGAVHAAAAFRAGNTDFSIDRQQGRTDTGTTAAIDPVANSPL